MPRPSMEGKVRAAVEEYLLVAKELSPEEASLNTLAVARRLGFDRKTLKKYTLDWEIKAAAQRQAQNCKISPKAIARRSIDDKLRAHETELKQMRQRCEALVAKICQAEGNAQRLGIDPAELWKPLTVPDRSLPHTGNRRFRN